MLPEWRIKFNILHWLPIAYRIRFKLGVLMHDVHNGTSASYLTDTITPISSFTRLSSASFSNDDWLRHASHQDKIWRQSFLCCWTARGECSSRRYKEHYRLIILQASRQDTLYNMGIFGLNSFPDCTMCGASGQFCWGCKMRHINGFTYLPTYLLTYWHWYRLTLTYTDTVINWHWHRLTLT